MRINCPACGQASLVPPSSAWDSYHRCPTCQRVFPAEQLVAFFRTQARRATKRSAAVVEAFAEKLKGGLPCGHTFGDLTWAPGSVTKCGACVAERQGAREAGRVK